MQVLQRTCVKSVDALPSLSSARLVAASNRRLFQSPANWFASLNSLQPHLPMGRTTDREILCFTSRASKCRTTMRVYFDEVYAECGNKKGTAQSNCNNFASFYFQIRLRCVGNKEAGLLLLLLFLPDQLIKREWLCVHVDVRVLLLLPLLLLLLFN